MTSDQFLLKQNYLLCSYESVTATAWANLSLTRSLFNYQFDLDKAKHCWLLVWKEMEKCSLWCHCSTLCWLILLYKMFTMVQHHATYSGDDLMMSLVNKLFNYIWNITLHTLNLWSHRKRVARFPSWDRSFFVDFFLSVSAWVSSGHSSLFPKSIDMQFRLTGDFKHPRCGCLSLYVSLVMNWQLVQCVPWRLRAPASLQPFQQ